MSRTATDRRSAFSLSGRLILKITFFCVGEYAEYGFDQQRLIWYVLSPVG